MKCENFQIPISTFHLYYLIIIKDLSRCVSTVYLSFFFKFSFIFFFHSNWIVDCSDVWEENIIIYSETSLCGHLVADRPIDFCWKWVSVTWTIWKRPVGTHLREVLLYIQNKLMFDIFYSINRLINFFPVLPTLKLTEVNLLYRSVTKYEPFLSNKNDLQCTTSWVQN
jgi:hypothetical protein